MKVLWLANVMFPEFCRKVGIPETVLGGWLFGYKTALRTYFPEIALHIISPYPGGEFIEADIDGCHYYAFPQSAHTAQLSAWLKQINDRIRPDVAHIHGSEYPHAYLFAKTCGGANAVLSIQGLVSVYARYYYGGLSPHMRSTLRDILKRDTLQAQKKSFERTGELERSLIGMVSNVAGRTSWDYAHCAAVNPNANYFHCEEPLRSAFYESTWSLRTCERHTIFVSQAKYPLKGFHKLLEALPIVKSRFPDVKVLVAGENMANKPWYKQRTYWLYLKKLMKRLDVEQNIRFVGTMSEREMVRQYLLAHLFISPSAIENSSNSVCEAQLLGTPVVSSYVGGMMDLVEDKVSGLLYRFEETEMLAEKICDVFADDDLAQRLSAGERAAAKRRHDRKSIAESLHTIYCRIAGQTSVPNGQANGGSDGKERHP